MEIELVIEHKPSNKGIKTKAWPSEEVGNKYDTLVGFGSRNNLPLSRKPVKDFGGQIPSLPKLLDVLLCDREGWIQTWWNV